MSATLPIAEVVIEDKSAVIPDITKLSLDSFGKLPNSEKGVADTISLLDLSQIIDLRDMRLGLTVSGLSNQQRRALTLDQYAFLSELTLLDMAELTNSYKIEIGDLPLAQTAFATFLQHPVLISERRLTLAQMLDRYPEIGNFKLGFIDLSQYNHEAIPGLLNIPIMSIPNWEQIKPAEIPGMRNMVLHQNIHLDGEVVTLRAVPEDGRVQIKLKNDVGLSIDWSEEPEAGLTPFESYSITPTLAGEKVIVSAYFSSCTNNLCHLIGPFQYAEHQKGDAVYVSAKDWALAGKGDTSTIDFNRQAIAKDEISNQTPFYKMPFVQAAIAGMGLIALSGLSLTYLLVQKTGKHHP